MVTLGMMDFLHFLSKYLFISLGSSSQDKEMYDRLPFANSGNPVMALVCVHLFYALHVF